MSLTSVKIDYLKNGTRRTRSIKSEVVGPLCIHPTMGDRDHHWTVTHIRSGRAVY